jgi:hypothetical protein
VSEPGAHLERRGVASAESARNLLDRVRALPLIPLPTEERDLPYFRPQPCRQIDGAFFGFIITERDGSSADLAVGGFSAAQLEAEGVPYLELYQAFATVLD